MSHLKPDTRGRNKYFNQKDPKNYLVEYAEGIATALKSIDSKELNHALDLITGVRAHGGHVYVAGNGGSSSISDHLCCDWMKGVYQPGDPAIKVHALSSNVALATAIANDISYDHVFSAQLEMYAKPGDLLVVISSSGNSINVVKAVEFAKSLKIPVITLTGFQGGALKTMGDANLYVPFDNYGVVEDGHQILMHVMAQLLYLRFKESSR